MQNPQSLTIFLASPRGFCAGVDRAIQIVRKALEKYGAPIYVRHEIVHNKSVVEELELRGAIFVNELRSVPDGSRVVFSAHGVPKSVPKEAEKRGLKYFDATCPLVSKVHRGAEQHVSAGRKVILIGHAGHPEVVGTLGQVEDGNIHLVETIEDAKNINPEDPNHIAYVTQTTLAVDDTEEIINVLKERFPKISSPQKEDICYATTNRQSAIKNIAQKCDAIIVIGALNSSNSVRLMEVAQKSGCQKVFLIANYNEINWDELINIKTIGLTAGASAPEKLVNEVLFAFKERFSVEIEEIVTTIEDISFRLPRSLET